MQSFYKILKIWSFYTIKLCRFSKFYANLSVSKSFFLTLAAFLFPLAFFHLHGSETMSSWLLLMFVWFSFNYGRRKYFFSVIIGHWLALARACINYKCDPIKRQTYDVPLLCQLVVVGVKKKERERDKRLHLMEGKRGDDGTKNRGWQRWSIIFKRLFPLRFLS
jgi:hypothetical protein